MENIHTDKIYYAHIRTADFKRPITVAYTEALYEQDGEVLFSVAQCSKRDHFCRRIGREVSAGRLKKGHCYSAGELNTHPEMIKNIISIIKKKGLVS